MTSTPDFTPFEARPMQIPYEWNTEASPGAAESASLDFDLPDQAGAALGRILWMSAKGARVPFPEHLAAGEGDED